MTQLAEATHGRRSRRRTPRRYRIPLERYDRMIAAGILTEDDPIQLIEGDLLEMAPIGSHHAGCVNIITRLMTIRLGERAIVGVQGPVRLPPDSEPEPDVTLLRPRGDSYLRSLPGPEDVLLLIEVSDTSLAFDQGRKLQLYARAGIAEVWIVDLTGQRLFTYRTPEAGAYRDTETLGRGTTVRPAAFRDLRLTVDELRGPAEAYSGD